MRRLFRNTLLFLTVLSLLICSSVYASWYYTQGYVSPVSDRFEGKLNTFIDLPEHSIGISDRFLMILNNDIDCNVTINSTAYDLSYDALIAALCSSPNGQDSNKKYVTLHNNSYMGTMQSKGEDMQAVRTMFGDVLVKWENETEDYQIMIKRDPLDRDDTTGVSYYMDGDHGWVVENIFYPGSEFVLFSTNWQSATGVPSGYVVVYATVYTRQPKLDADGNPIYALDAQGNIQYYSYTDKNGKFVTTSYPIYQYERWEKLNEENGYIGYAKVVNYSTGDASRSFDTGTWTSLSAYGTSSSRASLSEIVSAHVGNS